MSFLVTAVTTDNEVRTAMVSREAMYETIKEIVGGLIQPVRLPIPTEVLGTKKVEVYMYVNEEGILENLPRNAVASTIAETAFQFDMDDPTLEVQSFMGNAVFVAEWVKPDYYVAEDTQYTDLPETMVKMINHVSSGIKELQGFNEQLDSKLRSISESN
jgi:hypothetical protein